MQGHELMFDVVGHPKSDFQFAVTFPFHPYPDGRRGGDVTLLREYAQARRGGAGPARHRPEQLLAAGAAAARCRRRGQSTSPGAGGPSH